jgi:hypothetical protein
MVPVIGTFILVGLAWIVWKAIEREEYVSQEWLDNWKRENYGKEEDYRAGATDEKDTKEAKRLDPEVAQAHGRVLNTYQAEDAVEDLAELDPDLAELDRFYQDDRLSQKKSKD